MEYSKICPKGNDTSLHSKSVMDGLNQLHDRYVITTIDNPLIKWHLVAKKFMHSFCLDNLE